MIVHTCHFSQQESTRILRCKNGWAFSYLNMHQHSLSQVYAGQLRTRIQVIEKNKRVSYTGTIPSLTKDFILIKTTTGHINLKLKDIISIELVEEVLYESA